MIKIVDLDLEKEFQVKKKQKKNPFKSFSYIFLLYTV